MQVTGSPGSKIEYCSLYQTQENVLFVKYLIVIKLLPNKRDNLVFYYQRVKKVYPLGVGHEIKSLWPIFKAEMLICPSNANLDERICLVKSLVSKNQKLENAKGVCMKIENSMFHSGP